MSKAGLLYSETLSQEKKKKTDLPYDPAIQLLGIYPKERNTGYSKGTCTPMFTAALFTIARLWKQPRMDQENAVFIHNGILLRHEESNLTIASKWMELENIILSKVSQAQKTKNPKFSLICGL
jgi:hypothetical protein